MDSSPNTLLAPLRCALTACAASLLIACGGGGGTSPPPQSVPPSRPTSNRPPVLVTPNGTQVAVHRHAFAYDAAQGGTTFTDPDGDSLRYEIKFRHFWNLNDDPNPPPGLRVEGTTIVGTLEELDAVVVTISAFDEISESARNQFTIRVVPNTAPVATRPQEDRLVSVGAAIDFDATDGGASFTDADGDALTYEVKVRGQPGDITVTGTRVSGALNSTGLVEVTVTARDAYDGVGTDIFLVAAPTAEPGSPTLPMTSDVYKDEELDLPLIFRMSSESELPLWDKQPAGNRTTNAGATLGRVLFYDKRLSITNTVACSSCHEQSHGFARPERFSVGALGVPTKRNAMALANVRYNIQHFWFSDMRAETLQALVLEPLQNPEELGSSLQRVEAKLRATDFYPPLFEAAFGSPEITHERVARALAQFLQALISYRTEFDRAYNPMTPGPPDPAAVLDAQEMRGLEIFSETGRCTSCHELHANANEWQANNGIDDVLTDTGTQHPGMQRDGSLGVFRAASLRNVAVTNPYMHDGRFATLREVIEHYDHGVKDSPNLDRLLRSDTGPRRLNLSEQDKDALEAFLRTLTDTALLSDPKFSNPFH